MKFELKNRHLRSGEEDKKVGRRLRGKNWFPWPIIIIPPSKKETFDVSGAPCLVILSFPYRLGI
jgi:hypothetical protein